MEFLQDALCPAELKLESAVVLGSLAKGTPSQVQHLFESGVVQVLLKCELIHFLLDYFLSVKVISSELHDLLNGSITFRHRQRRPEVRRDVPLLHQVARLRDRFGESSDIWRKQIFLNKFWAHFIVLGNYCSFQESQSIPKLISMLSKSESCKEYVAIIFYRSCKVLWIRESS